jgi:hypothetical protein
MRLRRQGDSDGDRKAGFLRCSVGKLIQIKVTPIESRHVPGTGNLIPP